MDDARLERMFELIQVALVESRAEMNGRFDAVYGEIAGVRSEINARFDALHVDLAERFQSVLDRLDSLERRAERTGALLTEMRAELDKLRNEVRQVVDLHERLHMSVNSLSDEMRQRFRLVNERLSGMEKRLAA